MRISSTLTGQIAICLVLSLPIPTSLQASSSSSGGNFFAFILNLFIPLVVFCFLFGIKNSKGTEFKVTRFFIAALLWNAFWIAQFWTGLDLKAIAWIEKVYGVDALRPGYRLAAIFASYNAVAMTIVVISSYVVGKWMNGKLSMEEFFVKTLIGQIVICLVCCLPIQVAIFSFVQVFALMVIILELVIPLVVFCVFFRVENGKGSEFNKLRIMTAGALWGAFCIVFSPNSIPTVISFAGYNAVAIAMVVILSYAIVKWIDDLDKKYDEVNKKKE